jgi:transketolase
MRQSFGDTLYQLAKVDPRIYVVDAGLYPSLFLEKFKQDFAKRFIEAGVAESNATGVAAGLAKNGKVVFLTSFACFSPALNWGVIKQSICMNHANVKIIGSHAGLASGDLGATHQMLEDIALTRTMPGLHVFAPLDAVETKKIVTTVSQSHLPCYIRLSRPSSENYYDSKKSFTIGKSYLLHAGKDITILGYGPLLTSVLSLDIRNWKLEIINCSSLKPLDEETILKSLKKTGHCLVIEDHQKIGGLGEAVSHLIATSGVKVKFAHLAVDNSFGQSGTPELLYQHYGLSPSDIEKSINNLLSQKS